MKKDEDVRAAAPFEPTPEAVQAAEAYLQRYLLDHSQSYAGQQRARPFFNRAHPFLQQMIAQLVAEAPDIIAELIKLLGNQNTP